MRGQGTESSLRRGRRDSEGMRHLLASLVGSALRVEPAALCGAGRGTAEIAYARHVALYLAHTTLGLTYTEAGRLFGRDRTTAAHACRRIEERRELTRIDEFVDCLERAARHAAMPATRRGRLS
jgi:chromosomal replication initiation ATPase DnaA